MKKLGKHLADLRKKHHFKQKDLAREFNVSQQVISNVERGQSEPDIELLQKMADIYNISLDQLVGRDFTGKTIGDIEHKIINCIKSMDDKGKELSLDLLIQIAQYQGNKNGN